MKRILLALTLLLSLTAQAQVKISALPAAATPLAGTEVIPCVQSATTKGCTVSAINKPAGSTTQVQYNSTGAFAGNLDFTFTPSTTSPAVTIGDAGGLLLGSPTVQMLTGGTTNGGLIVTDDNLTIGIGGSGVVWNTSQVPTGYDPANFSFNICAPLGGTGMCLGFPANNDPYIAGETNIDTSLSIYATGSTSNATSTLQAGTDYFGSTGLSAGLACTNKNGFLNTGGGTGNFPGLVNAPHVYGCAVGNFTGASGAYFAFSSSNTYRGGIDGSGSWQIGNATAGQTVNIKTDTAAHAQVNGVQILTGFVATTGSIGGGALVAGACTSGTVAVTSSTTVMSVITSPVTYPGDGIFWNGYVSAAGTVTVKVCASVAATPTASTYNVRVLQ